jgi:hypothetical protein
MATIILMPPELRQNVTLTPEFFKSMISPKEYRRRYAKLAPYTKELIRGIQRPQNLTDEEWLRPLDHQRPVNCRRSIERG